ncbi:MAG: T9SS type A sorting domain-containing protein [Candidatus Zixiibacteriota bacterium]
MLSQNYPNPFSPQTVIEYALPTDCEVKITIYNILGQRVRTLFDESQEAGYRRIEWDSKNDGGHEVATGIYFYKIKAGDFVDSKKMVILK